MGYRGWTWGDREGTNEPRAGRAGRERPGVRLTGALRWAGSGEGSGRAGRCGALPSGGRGLSEAVCVSPAPIGRRQAGSASARDTADSLDGARRRGLAGAGIGCGPSRGGPGAGIGCGRPPRGGIGRGLRRRGRSSAGAGQMGRRRRGYGAAGVGTLPEAIAALSRALPGGPSPETFRRAKFDRPEAVRVAAGLAGRGRGRRAPPTPCLALLHRSPHSGGCSSACCRRCRRTALRTRVDAPRRLPPAHRPAHLGPAPAWSPGPGLAGPPRALGRPPELGVCPQMVRLAC